MMPFRFATTLFFTATLAVAAQEPKSFNFVTPDSKGRVILPLGNEWQPQSIALLDEGKRPVITFENRTSRLVLSLILFPNTTGQPTSTSCRDAVMRPILDNLATSAVVKDEAKETRPSANGLQLAVQSYLIEKVSNTTIHQQNLFGFYGSRSTCAEVHVSKAEYDSADAPQFASALKLFRFDPQYQPSAQDYSVLGSIFFASAHDFASAAVYYQRGLDTLAATPANLNMQRILTDQLSMSYGMSGDIAQSRKINEEAIARDPDYPIYYYDLACADAEENNATAAHQHLQQAFDRRKNTLPGETFPDPATDDSFSKLKENPEFWSFVTQLSAQEKKETTK